MHIINFYIVKKTKRDCSPVKICQSVLFVCSLVSFSALTFLKKMMEQLGQKDFSEASSHNGELFPCVSQFFFSQEFLHQ